MIIKPEFISNRTPGYAEIRIPNFTALEGGDLEFSIKRSGDGSFLGDGGWQSKEIWLRTPPKQDGADCLVPMGPELVNPIAECISSFAFQMSVKVEGEARIGAIKKTSVTLLASQAGGVGHTSSVDRLNAAASAPPPPPPPTPAPALDEVVVPKAIVAPEPAPVNVPPANDSKTGLIVAAVVGVFLLVAAAGGAYYFGLFSDEQQAEVTPPNAASSGLAPMTPTMPAPSAATPTMNTRQIVSAFLATNPNPDAMFAKGQNMAKEGRIDGSMLLYRRAASKGNMESAVSLAKMYDPKFFSKASSPLPSADVETAIYWYEKAHAAGSAEAKSHLERLQQP